MLDDGFSADGASAETEIKEDTVATINTFRKTGNDELTGPIRTLAFLKARLVRIENPRTRGLTRVPALRPCL
ncbi:hypothetical protein ABIF50_009355 [Bradyrhizobium diazoefficiens]|nr:hypothetical protein [Bradyrhizobium diazoefficiens]MBR0866758.1 hypothetical protein [Bradyrhizobium diazoefficiens]MBR0891254.1 hypothetical protein [Bradyrhizobium diazoefficiens]MBR0923033.1 hypothetical protein [Bradyrhizobium diazoefficiens]